MRNVPRCWSGFASIWVHPDARRSRFSFSLKATVARAILSVRCPCSSADRALASGVRCAGSSPARGTKVSLYLLALPPFWYLKPSCCYTRVVSRLVRCCFIGAWPSGRAPGLGPGGRRFESARPDHNHTVRSSGSLMRLLINVSRTISRP